MSTVCNTYTVYVVRRSTAHVHVWVNNKNSFYVCILKNYVPRNVLIVQRTWTAINSCACRYSTRFQSQETTNAVGLKCKKCKYFCFYNATRLQRTIVVTKRFSSQYGRALLVFRKMENSFQNHNLRLIRP